MDHLDPPCSAFLLLSLGLMRRHSLFRKKKIFIKKLRIIQLVIRYALKVLIFGFSLDHFSYWCNCVPKTGFPECLFIFKIIPYGPLFLAKME